MRVNPFDIRTVVLAKHAQHVVLIHFPLALFIAAVAFDYLAQWTKNQGARRGGVFQSAAGRGVDCASRGDRLCGVAVGARGTDAEGDSVDAPGSGLRLECLDLACVLDPLACAAPSVGSLAAIPAANRSRRGTARGVDGASRRVSQWRERSRLGAVTQRTSSVLQCHRHALSLSCWFFGSLHRLERLRGFAARPSFGPDGMTYGVMTYGVRRASAAVRWGGYERRLSTVVWRALKSAARAGRIHAGGTRDDCRSVGPCRERTGAWKTPAAPCRDHACAVRGSRFDGGDP